MNYGYFTIGVYILAMLTCSQGKSYLKVQIVFFMFLDLILLYLFHDLGDHLDLV